MVREQRPGVHRECPRVRQGRQVGDEFGPVWVVAEEGRPLDPPHHHVVETPGASRRCLAQHSGDGLASISTVLEFANRAGAQANCNTSCLSPNQGIGVGVSAKPDAAK
jgi:hypothetical protein